MSRLILALVIAYFIGGIPIGLMVSKLWGKDLRRYGSGNIGTTNALRVLGKGAAALTFVGDALKGMAGVYVGMLLTGSLVGMAACGVGAVFGQTYPVYLGFKGGKGVATSLGASLFLSSSLGGTLAVIWLVVVILTRYVSLSSVTAAVCATILVFLWRLPPELYLFTILAGGNVLFRHRDNIKRLLAGKEYKIGERAS